VIAPSFGRGVQRLSRRQHHPRVAWSGRGPWIRLARHGASLAVSGGVRRVPRRPQPQYLGLSGQFPSHARRLRRPKPIAYLRRRTS
jgi:hypothetical protein